MAQEIIYIGELPNDGTGDTLRTAFKKVNDNFTQLFATSFETTSTYTIGNTANQVLFQYPVASVSLTQGKFYIRSSFPSSNDSQNITLDAQIYNDQSNVVFSAYGTTFIGNVLCNYDMDIHAGNVRILCNPFPDEVLLHVITGQLTYFLPGDPIQLDNYANDTFLVTEDGLLTLITEFSV